jgi:transcriptional regulator with GAF, ATPase, and Fis domain
MPLPLYPHEQKIIIEKILDELDRVETLPTLQERAASYYHLGNAYRRLHMYGRALKMYRYSLDAGPSDTVATMRAQLLASLVGEEAWDEVLRIRPPASVGALDDGYDAWQTIMNLIKQHADAVNRHKQKVALERQFPPLRRIVGESQHILDICRVIIQVAPTTLSVLITGETGTGKELVAKAIHDCSPRMDHPFEALNCASVPDGLLESEFFGHEKGAFTGAINRKLGKFEHAHRGTLFLDEVGDLSLAAQAKLLRAIQEHKIERVGGTAAINVDVRLVSATNKSLLNLIQAGEFRRDLYDRLNGTILVLKPLGQRLGDLSLLAMYFLKEYKQELGNVEFSAFDVHHWLAQQYLPEQERSGAAISSIREFSHSVRRAVMDKKLYLWGDYPFEDVLTYQGQSIRGARGYTPEQLQRYNREIALEVCTIGKQAAKLLGISASTLSRAKGQHKRPNQ